MSKITIEEILEQKLIVVAALDQRPFENVGATGVISTFCPLVPLLTARGEVLDMNALEQLFPNRGRLWWKLRNEIPTNDLFPGTLVSGIVESADRFRFTGESKDRYQLAMASAQVGARNIIQWIRSPLPAEDPAELLNKRGFPFPFRPLSSVVISSGGWVLGPLRSHYDPEKRRVNVEPIDPSAPKAWRLKISEFKSGQEYQDFKFIGNRWAKDSAEEPVSVTVLLPKGLQKLESEGEVIDAATDDQVVEWALRVGQLARKDRQAFKEALNAVAIPQDLADAENPERARRFQLLIKSSERILALSEEVAREIATRHEDFQKLVENHAAALADAKVTALVEQRREEIEQQTLASRQTFDQVRQELSNLDAEYDRKKAEQEERLREELGKHWKAIEQREDELRRKQEKVQKEAASLEEREGDARERLKSLILEYEVRGEEIAQEVLTQLPVLRHLTPVGGNGWGAAAAGEAVTSTLQLPAFLKQTVAKSGLTEKAFIAQFREVAERRGFAFSEGDLVNFHICVKIGTWTVVAGPSGLGKSSLPRLYAEALGAASEYRVVRVRPDWLDDRDVLGAYNALNARFEPGISGLVDSLIAAQEDLRSGRGGIHLVCLDEMNLARVEHYFSQFLSLLEEPPNRRVLELFPAGLEQKGDPFAPFRMLKVGENLRFIGTVNVDETTHFFSPKVLDRVPILKLEVPSLNEGLDKKAVAEELSGLRPVHLLEFQAWVREPVKDVEALKLLVQIDEELRALGLALGFRVRNRVLKYLASSSDLLPRDRALDFAIAQSAMPRLRSTSPRFHDCLERLGKLCPKDRFPRTHAILEALQQSDGEHDFFRVL